MPQCPQCREVVTAGAERCPHCGAWIADASKSDSGDLRSAILSLMKQGAKIEAIKLYRTETGVGLAEAKSAVEQIERSGFTPASDSSTGVFEKQILELVAAGQTIAAIKLHREQTGSGLKEAKDAVENIAARHGVASPAGAGCFGVLGLLLCAILKLIG